MSEIKFREVKLLYERKSAKKPFLPSVGFKGLSRPPRRLLNEVVEDEEAKRETFSKDEEFIDAETGEPLQLTKAKWTAKEGRLSLNAKTILNMGTGQLDLNVRSAQKNTRPDYNTMTISTESTVHPLVAKFLNEGPQTAVLHQNWNPRTNEVDFEGSSLYESSSNGSLRSLQKKQALEMLISPTNNEKRDMITKYNAEYKPLIPYTIDPSQTSNWNAVYEKTYNDLFSMAEQIERNKSLTLEKKITGGLPAIRRTCQQLARQRVKFMQEIVQAIQDEENKEKTRELYELENYDKKDLLKDIRKNHREERKKGKLYIEALQRDQEIIFMTKLREAGLLW